MVLFVTLLSFFSELDDAMKRRDLQDLQRLINKAEALPHMCKKLAAKVKQAKKLLETVTMLRPLKDGENFEA